MFWIRITSLAMILSLFSLPLIAADRTVLIEHFTEDGCTWCGQVADAIDTFRQSHCPGDVAIITYSTSGSQTVPGGADRMDAYDFRANPANAGDGKDELGPQPIDIDVLNNYLELEQDLPSPATMDVFKINDSKYSVHIEAKSSINGVLVVVAYEDIVHDSHHYPVFARQILSNTYGDPISLNSGDVFDQEYNISIQGGWNPANMGVVAFVQENSKFRPAHVFQSADSQAPHQNPTATPTPLDEPTPTPTSSNPFTPTPTPTFSEANLLQELELNKTMFYPYDLFDLKIHTQNPSDFTYNVNLYLALQVGNSFFFAPSWTLEIESMNRAYAPGYDDREGMLSFEWPSSAGTFSPLYFWLASIDASSGSLAGPYSNIEWGYGE